MLTARPPGKGRNAGKLAPSAPVHPRGKPDIDKLARSTLSSLTGIVFDDDSRIVALSVAKVYAAPRGGVAFGAFTQWYPECATNANDCSIALRIDDCSSSVLFTGDAEALEEADLPIDKPVTLLQLGHHGSKTSFEPGLLDRAKPRYAVISAGRPGEGAGRTYCHPRKETVDALTAVLGDAGAGVIHAFSATPSCHANPGDVLWVDEPASAWL